MKGVWQRKLRNIWGERVQEGEKWWQDSDMEEEERRCRMCYEERNKAFVVIFSIEHFAVLFLVKRNQKRFLVQLDWFSKRAQIVRNKKQ
jgi:hypothetical protein